MKSGIDPNAETVAAGMRGELLRKGLHLSVALAPAIAAANRLLAIGLLAFGTLFYAGCELARRRGREIPIISKITALSARGEEAGRFVLGPLTLGAGALLALLLFPAPAAAVAILALAFGDGAAALVGRRFGRHRLPLTGGKSLEGSLACLAAVFLATLALTFDPLRALAIAAVATLAEAAPIGDLDNLLVPLLAGAAATALL
jgi:dolichol kinase